MAGQSVPRIILIDDEADIRHLLTMTLIQMKLDVVSCKNLTEAKEVLSQESFDFCLTDLKLPDGDGLEMVSYCKKHYSNMPIAVITAYSTTEKAIEAMKLGAFDFLSKPIDLNHLRQLLKHAFKFSSREDQQQTETIYRVLTGNDKYASDLRHQLSKVRGSQAPVIIQGSPGTEKEVLAKIIHHQSSRSEQPFVVLDFESQPASMHEKLLFGDDQGHGGKLSSANQGTLVLHNLHLLAHTVQKRFLKAIEEKSLLIGNNDELENLLDIRVIVCTERSFNNYFQHGMIREELYFRLSVVNIKIPDLKDRKEDLATIASSFLNEFDSRKTLGDGAIEKLKEHNFPYNYRELENTLFKAATLSESNTIEPEDLILVKTNATTKSAPLQSSNARGDRSLEDFLDDIERDEITKALEKTRWNRTEAAKLLKISFRTIRYKMKKLDIQ